MRSLNEDEEDELEKVSKVLDKAIERDQHHHCHNLYKAMILLADVAVAQQNPDKAKALLEQVCESPDVVQITRRNTKRSCNGW